MPTLPVRLVSYDADAKRLTNNEVNRNPTSTSAIRSENSDTTVHPELTHTVGASNPPNAINHPLVLHHARISLRHHRTRSIYQA